MLRRTLSVSGPLGGAILPLFLAVLLPVLAHTASAQQQLTPGARAPTAQTPPPLANAPPLIPAATPTAPPAATPPATAPGAATPMTPLPVDWGLCQCIADKKNLDFTCPGSADACRSACGNQFSFKPDARCRQAAASQ
jgi:hypothetical protein